MINQGTTRPATAGTDSTDGPATSTPWARLRLMRARAHMPRLLRGRLPAWFVYLGVLGPGLVSASAGNDVGGIATYASIGARYGYDMIWVMVAIAVPLLVIQEQCARMGAVTGKGLTDLIREEFGPRWTVLVMLGLLIANGGVIVSEFVGIGAAAELFGVNRYLVVPIMAVVVWWLIVKGNYRQVERVFLALTLVFLAYPISAILAHPDWGQALHSAVVPTFRPDPAYILLFVATVGTTISPYMQVGQQDLVVEKGVTADELGSTRVGVVVGTVFAILVAIFIIIATAATLYDAAVRAGQPGVEITTADQAARALQPLAGRYAEALFGIGIFGASMLAAGVLPLATALSVCEAFGWERGVELDLQEAPVFYGLLTFLIAAGAVVALTPGVPVIHMLIAVQVINGLVLPIILICVTRIAGNREVMGQYANGRLYKAAAWLITASMAALALLMVVTTILPAVGVSF